MPTPTVQNLNNTEILTTAPELIEFFKEADNPWAKFFPIKKVQSVNVKFIIKKPSTNIQKVTDKSARLDVNYVETETILKTITNMYTHGEKIAEVDLEAENGQNLQDTMAYEVANNLNNQIGKDDITEIGNSATVVEIAEDSPVGNLTAMLTAWDKLFQLRNSANCRFFITNEIYDKLVYLANNKGLITDNTIAQQLRLDGSKLYVKGVECEICLDDYMTFGEEKIPFILATPRAMTRFYLENMKVYREPVKDGKLPKMILVGGEVMSDAILYLAKTETTSRWMMRGKYKAARKPLSDIIKKIDLSGEIVPVPTSKDRPVPGQIVNAVIALNSGATINDFSVGNVSVVNFPIEKDDPKNPTPGTYINGDYTATVIGAGKYEGTIDIKGKFGRLNTYVIKTETEEDKK